MLPGPSSKIGFEVRVGDLVASSDFQSSKAVLGLLRTELGLGAGIGKAVVDLLPFGVAAPKPGDPMEVDLDGGEGSSRVFTGTVSEVIPQARSLRVVGEDGRALLARVDVEAVFEESTLADIAKDLIGRAGLEPGEIQEGPTFPSYVLHRGPRALRHLLGLAELCGLDLLVDTEGKVHLIAPTQGSARQTLTWGKELLDLSLRREVLAPDGVEVFGEGAASTQGAEKAHWLVTDLESVSGKAALSAQNGAVSVKADATGDLSVLLRSGALRSGDAAKAVAKGRAEALAARALTGRLLLGGCPTLVPGDCVAVSELPRDHAASKDLPAALRIRTVIHRLDRRSGLTTTLVL